MSRQINSIYGRTVGGHSPSQQLAISSFMSKAYGWMFIGLLVTAGISFFTVSSETALQFILGNRLVFYGILISEVLLVMGLSAALQRLSPLAATLGFLAYAGLNGLTFSSILMAYQMSSISQVFFIAAGMFGGLAFFGTVTKKDLTAVGTFVGMGVWGLILIGFANLFFQSEALSLGLSTAGVLIFSGLTAYDAQRIRGMAYQYATESFGNADRDKGAIFGALSLYLNFINLFLSLLRLFGDRRR